MEGNPELANSMKKVSWQPNNCLSCIWFVAPDPYNADLMDKGPCTHPTLKQYQLVVSGRDWCNLFQEIPDAEIAARKKRFAENENKE